MKNLIFSALLSLLALSYNHLAWGIVDYTSQSTGPEEESRSTTSIKKTGEKSELARESKRPIWKSDWSLGTHFESQEINGEKINSLHMNTHIQTPVNVYVDLAYWNAITGVKKSEGNPRAIIGFNWLRLGTPEEEARLNFYGGGQFASKSEIATSRTDKIVGVETTKRFENFGLGIGYDLTLVGTPKNEREMVIGNIGRLAISAGWMVSNDIQFEIEVENFTIARAKSGLSANQPGLDEKLSFSTLSPKLSLGLSRIVNLQMGARFRMKKMSSRQDLSAMKVFDLHGANGNSLFAGLGLSF